MLRSHLGIARDIRPARIASWLVAPMVAVLVTCSGPGGGASSPAGADAQRAARLASAEPFTIEGPWSGFFLDGMQLVRLDMQLAETPTAEDDREVFSGEATLAEIALPGSTTQRAGGSAHVEVRLLHDPATATFSLEMPRALESDPSRLARRFRGVVGAADPVHHRLAGFHGGQAHTMDQFFRFTRPEEVDATLAAYRRFAGPGPNVRPTLPGARPEPRTLGDLFGGFEKPDPDVVLGWAAGIASAYDRRNPRRSNAVTPTEALLLFADEPFTRAFGAPFDGLSDDALDGLYALTYGDFLHERDPAKKAVANLAAMFKRSDAGSPNGLQTLQGVLALRTLRHWLADRVSRMASTPVGAQGYALCTRMQDVLGSSALGTFSVANSPLAAVFWPSERSDALDAADRAREVQAYAALERTLDDLARAPHTQATWDACFHWTSTEAGDYTLVTAAQREALGTRLTQTMESVLDELLEPDRARRPAYDTDDVSWIAAEVSWWARLRHDHPTAWFKSPLVELQETVLAEREEALSAALPALERAIADMPWGRLAQVDAVWFSLPGDKDTPTHAAAMRAVAQRRQVIDAAVAAAQDEAAAIVAADPARPLPFLDVRDFEAPGFLRFVYFGTSGGVDGRELIDAWNAGDLRALADERHTLQRFQSAFRIYHRGFYERYGKTEADRERRSHALGETWTGIQTQTVTRDQWGNEIDRVDGFVHTWVRMPYAQKYLECEQTEGDLWGDLWLGLAVSNEASKRGGDPYDPGDLPFEDPTNTEVSPLDAALATREEYAALFEAFLDEHEQAHPATVRHFERNLMALVSGGRLTPPEGRLDVDGF